MEIILLKRLRIDMEKNTMQQGIIKGAMILAAASFISKIIGMLYRIPVTNILGDVGNGIYSQAFTIYTTLLTLSAVGIPSAISKMISERIAVGAYKDAQRVYKIAMIYSTVIAAVLALIMWVGAGTISQVMIQNTSLVMPIKALAPTIVVVTIMAVMRGYFQGMNNMAPSGISQVIEQLFNAIFSVVLAYVLIGKGIEAAATGSTLGTGIGALAGLLFMIFIYYLTQGRVKKRIQTSTTYEYETSATILKKILLTTIPIVISTSIFSIMTNIDSAMIARMLPDSIEYLQNNNLLQSLPVSDVTQIGVQTLDEMMNRLIPPSPVILNLMKEYDIQYLVNTMVQRQEIKDILVGQYFGKYFTLINVPVSLILTMGTAAIPSIAAAKSIGDFRDIRNKIRMILKIGMLLGVPAAVGIGVFATPIMGLLFKSAPDGGELLTYGAISIIFITIAQLTTGVLQGMGKQQVPTIHAIIACIIKVILNFILLSIPTLHIYAVIHSTTVCYIIYAVLNVIYLRKTIELKLNWKTLLIKPAISAAIMGAVAYGLYILLCGIKPMQGVWLMVVVPIAALVYAAIGLLTGTITKRDIENIPGGKKIINRFF